MNMYFISLGLLLFGALISLTVKEEWKLKICSFFSAISTVLLLITSFNIIKSGKIAAKSFYLSSLFGDVNIVADSLSAFFIIVISLMSFLGVIYAAGYMKPYILKGRKISGHCFFLMMLIISMLMVVTIQNSLFFLVVWEIMSLSSFFLVIFEGDKKEVLSAGIKYMVYMHISVLLLICAFALLNIKTGSLNFSDFVYAVSQNKHFANVIFVLFFAGFGIKAGFAPFHTWLPEAHPAAPSHVSAIMSGVMIKTGIYGILRVLTILGMPTKFIAYTVLITALLSAMYGVLYAISQHDIKRLLAYHSIENIGIIGIGIGAGLLGVVYSNPMLAVLGFSGGIFHILNHSLFKELLFLSAGSVYTKTHTRDVELLGGLIKKMPYTAVLFIIASVAICGLPPFNGFISEFLIYGAIIIGLPAPNIFVFLMLIVSLAALALVGTMAVLCFTKASGVMFLGNPRSQAAKDVKEDVPPVMTVPMTILAILICLIGIFPQYFIKLITAPVSAILQGSTVEQIMNSVVNLTGSISLLCLIFIVIFITVFIFVSLMKKKPKEYSVWACGYDKPNNRMQYSASSYADLFISTLRVFFKRISHIKKPSEIFPKEAYYEMETEDIEEAYILKPLLKIDERFLAMFEKIQNGNMRHYILFGLIFLILSIIGLIYIG